jgi:hypothetical protein
VPTAIKGINAVNASEVMLKAGELASMTTALYSARGVAELAQR